MKANIIYNTVPSCDSSEGWNLLINQKILSSDSYRIQRKLEPSDSFLNDTVLDPSKSVLDTDLTTYITLQLLNRLLLVIDNKFNQITNRNHS